MKICQAFSDNMDIPQVKYNAKTVFVHINFVLHELLGVFLSMFLLYQLKTDENLFLEIITCDRVIEVSLFQPPETKPNSTPVDISITESKHKHKTTKIQIFSAFEILQKVCRTTLSSYANFLMHDIIHSNL